MPTNYGMGNMQGPQGGMHSGNMQGPPNNMQGPTNNMQEPHGNMQGPHGNMQEPPYMQHQVSRSWTSFQDLVQVQTLEVD